MLRPLIRFHIYTDCTNFHDIILYTTGSFISTDVVTTASLYLHHSGHCHEIFNNGPDDVPGVGSAPEFRVLAVMILNISVISPV